MERIESRRPNFGKIYKSRASFLKVKKDLDQLPKRMESLKKPVQKTEGSALFKSIQDSFNKSDALKIGTFNTKKVTDYLSQKISTKIVSAATGRIENLLLTVPSYLDNNGNLQTSSWHARHYKWLISALGSQRNYTVVCHPDLHAEIESWFNNANLNQLKVTFVFSPKFDYSIWAQDAYVTLQNWQGQSILCEGVLFPRYDDMTIADDVSTQTDVSLLQSSLYFQGGNVLGAKNLTIIGQDYIWKNLGRYGLESEAKVLSHFENLLGTPILNVGNFNLNAYQWYNGGILSGYGFQPIFHIDMYITPTGVIGASGKEIVMFGRPKKAHEITGLWSEDSRFNNSDYDAFFEQTENQLAQHFEVVQLPLMLTFGNLNGMAGSSKFYNLSFNNVVLENYVKNGVAHKTVVMTTYAQDYNVFGTNKNLRETLENAAQQIWESIGFTVKRMDGMEDLAYGDGSIHCITKALKRME